MLLRLGTTNRCRSADDTVIVQELQQVITRSCASAPHLGISSLIQPVQITRSSLSIGRTFWFMRNRLSGSYVRLILASRV